MFAFPRLKWFFLVLVLALSGCAGWSGGQNASSELLVQYAVLKYIDDDQLDAQRVYETVQRMDAAVKAAVEATIPELAEIALNQIDFDQLDAADQLLAMRMVRRVAHELEDRQEQGSLPGDVVLSVRTVLRWASDAAIIAGASK